MIPHCKHNRGGTGRFLLQGPEECAECVREERGFLKDVLSRITHDPELQKIPRWTSKIGSIIHETMKARGML
jgi:hypothetical protein